jgi:hypothetical protein
VTGALVVCLMLILVAQAPAAPSGPRAAFKQLRHNVRTAKGVSPSRRRSLLRTIRRAERQAPCAAITTLERVRTGEVRVRGVGAVELAIARTRSGARCAMATRRVTLPRPQLTAGGELEPLPPVRKKPDEDDELPATPVTGEATLPDAGPPTTIAPAGAASALQFPTVSDLGSPKQSDRPAEPSQASAGRVVWYTGNTGAAFSLDHGRTFKEVKPAEMFPGGEHPFCCDQVVLYSPRINRFIWLMQYWCPRPDLGCEEAGSTNIDRLAVASPHDIIENRRHPEGAWTSWVVTPRDVHHRSAMLDYPDLGLGAHSLYLSSNVFGRNGVFGLVGRIKLAELRRAGVLHLDYAVSSRTFSPKVVQGVGRRGLFASHATDRRLLTLAWDEGSPLLFPHRTSHARSVSFDYASITGPEGFEVDWNERTDDRLTGATLRGDQIWVAWSEGRSSCTARCDGRHPVMEQVWPQPHVHVVAVDARSFDLVDERFIHNPDFAIAYPTLATDGNGQVGLSFSFGGGTAGNVSPAAGYLTDDEGFRQIAGSPTAGDQGDYFSLQPDWPDRSRLTGSGYVSGDDGEADWLFFRMARGG